MTKTPTTAQKRRSNRVRKQPERYQDPEFWKLMLEDVPVDELDYVFNEPLPEIRANTDETIDEDCLCDDCKSSLDECECEFSVEESDFDSSDDFSEEE